MNSENLKTFITLANNCNFTQTAQKHVVVQSTVSSRIKDLENMIGQKLFIRDRNNVTLTPAGKAFLDYAIRIVELEFDAINEVNMLGKFSERLTIGVVHSLYDCHLHPYIAEFVGRHPDVSVKVTLGHSRQIISSLTQNMLDIGFTYRSCSHPSYNCIPYKNDRIVFVTGSQNRKYQNGMSKDKVCEVPLLHSDFCYLETTKSVLPEYYQYSLEVDVASKLVPFLTTGEYYSFLPYKIVEEQIQNGLVIEIPIFDTHLPLLQSYMIYKINSVQSGAVQEWLNMY